MEEPALRLYKYEDNRSRLAEAVRTAAHLNQNIEGLVGQVLTSATIALRRMAEAARFDYDNLWVMKADSKKLIDQQQFDALTSCRELSTGFRCLHEMFAVQHAEYKRQSIITTAAVDTAAEPSAPQDSPLFCSGGSPKEVKEEPEEDERGEDLTDIKEEPLDEEYPEVKMEEEPIADMFCPTTGICRPIDGATDAMGYYDAEQPGTSHQHQARTPPPSNESTMVASTANGALNPMDCQQPPYLSKFDESSVSRDLGKLKARFPLNCYLCGKVAKKSKRAPPMGDPARAEFLERVIPLTVVHMAKVEVLKKNGARPVFCSSHITPVPGEPPEPDAEEEEEEEEPATPRAKRKSSLKSRSQATRSRKKGGPGVPTYEQERNKAQYAMGMDTTKCYLCGELTTACRRVPMNDLARRCFLKRIIQLTATHKAKIAALKQNGNQPFICLSHIASPPQKAKAAPAPAPSLSTTIKRAALCGPQRKCTLCGGTELPCVYSPKDPAEARIFFDSLIGISPVVRANFEWFLENDTRVTVCRSHIREAPAKAVMSTQRRLERLMEANRARMLRGLPLEPQAAAARGTAEAERVPMRLLVQPKRRAYTEQQLAEVASAGRAEGHGEPLEETEDETDMASAAEETTTTTTLGDHANPVRNLLRNLKADDAPPPDEEPMEPEPNSDPEP